MLADGDAAEAGDARRGRRRRGRSGTSGLGDAVPSSTLDRGRRAARSLAPEPRGASSEVLEAKGRRVRLAWRPEHTYVDRIGGNRGGNGHEEGAKRSTSVWAALAVAGRRARVRRRRLRRRRRRRASGDWQIEGLGSTLEEIQANAKERGRRSTSSSGRSTRRSSTSSTAATGCKVNTKDAGTGDDMISLIQSGEYDGVSASGHTSVRLMAAGDVAPVNADLLPNYADIAEGIKLQVVQLEGRRAVRRTARPRAEPARVPHRRGHAGAGQLVGRSGTRTRRTRARSRSTTTRSSSRTPPLYLKATQPDLGIENPYQLTPGAVRRVGRPAQDARAERRRVVGRLREADPVVREQGQRRRHDVAAPGQRSSTADNAAGRGRSSRRRARRAGRTRG